MAKKNDAQVTQDVIDELMWDPAVTVADLNVITTNGEVTLQGTADTFGTKDEATDAAYRVGGVRNVKNNITVNPEALGLRDDADIASRCQKRIRSRLCCP